MSAASQHPAVQPARRAVGWAAFWLSLPLLFPTAAAVGASWLAPLSVAGRFQAAGALLLVVGMATLPLRRRTRRRLPLSRAGLSLLVAGLAWRAMSVHAAAPSLRLVDLAGGPAPPQLASVREGDVVVAAADLLTRSGGLRPHEARGLAAGLSAAYLELEASVGRPPPVFERQALGRGGAAGEALVVAPPDPAPAAGVLFLHGYGGSFAWPCWAVSRAAERIGALTLCPSGPIDGRWTVGVGPQRVDAALRWLRKRGVQRVYLAGLSAGGISAPRLLRRRARRFAGLILLSGGDRRGRSGGLPVLAVHGTADSMVSAGATRAFAARHSGVRTVLLKGNHFVLLHRRVEVTRAVARWLRAVERRHRSPGRRPRRPTQRTQRRPTSGAL